MKVALIDSLGVEHIAYWDGFLQALGIERYVPQHDLNTTWTLGEERLPEAPFYWQITAGQILEMSLNSDAVLLPHLAGSVLANSSNPWLTDPELMLSRNLSVPVPEVVPAYPEHESTPRRLIELGTAWVRNGQSVRRASEKVRPLLHLKAPSPPVQRAGTFTVAVLVPRFLAQYAELLRPAFDQAGLYPQFSYQLSAAECLVRSSRVQLKYSTTAEQEMLGALNILEGKGTVRGLVLLVADRDIAALQFAKTLAAKARKATLILPFEYDKVDVDSLKHFAIQLQGEA